MGKMKKILALGMSQIMVAGLLAGGLVTSEVQAASVKSYNGHYYMFVNKAVDAGTAEYMCDLKGAHLVTITSAAEEKFVKENLSGDTDIWLGAKKVNKKWKWVTGEKFSYTNWHEGEPSNGSSETYLSTWEGAWDDCSYDKNGSTGNAYVMEWDSKSAYNAYVSGNTKKMVKNITGTKTYNGHIYKYYDMKTTWKKASAYCKKMGGYLTTLTSKKENNFAYNLCGKSNAWIGLNDAKKEGKFVWVTGERTDYLNFGSSLDNAFDGKEDYVGFYRENKWNDYTNTGSSEGNLGFICEWDNSNPVILTAVKSSVTVKKGRTTQLKYQIYPVKKKVTFKSSNTKVATVNKKGVVKGKKAGKSVITIKSGNKTVKVKVTVKK